MKASRLSWLHSAASITAWIVVALICVATARADWNIGDPYKMHYPQLPDPNGVDVNFASPQLLADDWLCTESGPVSDVHLWFSSFNDASFMITNVHVSIHMDVPAIGGSNSHPGAVLWQRDFTPAQMTIRQWGTGVQGWYDPYGQYLPANHTNIWQLNIENIVNPFVQANGTIYWLDVSVAAAGGPLGWKTSMSPHFGDDAVWWNSALGIWAPLETPEPPYQSLDMAFVITPEPNTLMLVALGLAGLWFGFRNRKR